MTLAESTQVEARRTVQGPRPAALLMMRNNRERSGLVIVVEQLRVAPPGCRGAKRPFGRATVQVILKLDLKSRARCSTTLALFQDAADVRGQWYEPQ